jgi:putative lipoprotein
MRIFSLSLWMAVLGLGVAGCASDAGLAGDLRPTMSGTVVYQAQTALPSSAVLTLRLLDVTRADAPAVVLAERSISNPGNPPIPFRLSYPIGGIQPGRRYEIEARIEVAGRLTFYSIEKHEVTPQNAAQPHEVRVERADEK